MIDNERSRQTIEDKTWCSTKIWFAGVAIKVWQPFILSIVSCIAQIQMGTISCISMALLLFVVLQNSSRVTCGTDTCHHTTWMSQTRNMAEFCISEEKNFYLGGGVVTHFFHKQGSGINYGDDITPGNSVLYS